MQKCALPFIHRYIKTDLYRGNVVDSNQAITSLELGSFCASGIALLKRFTRTLRLSSEDMPYDGIGGVTTCMSASWQIGFSERISKPCLISQQLSLHAC